MKKEELLKELAIKEEDIKRLKKVLKEKKEVKLKKKEKKPNFFVSISNTIFRNFSLNLSNKPFFKNYGYDLRKANIPLLLPSYLSLLFFTTLLAFILSFIFAISLSVLSGNLLSIIKNMGFSILFTAIVFLFLFLYPKMEVKNIERKIDAELPFAALYMASIAGAGVQPVKVLNLLAESQEYREIAKQISKITNKINVFGMDLVTAIKESSNIIANKRFVEMLNGLATNMVTGGDLKAYLEEEAKKFLTEYKVSREKFTMSAGVYADIYTGLLIAAPLIFMLVLVLINLFGGTLAGLSVANIAVFGLFILVLLNIIFLIYLQIVTPPV